MPNTPGAIGAGITGLFAAKGVTASDKMTATSSLLIALGWCGLRRSLGSSAERPYFSALLIHS